MSKKTIVLADNSYTIRRIVELSFSEEQEIELVSFETSLNLREKLLELRPHIVLVDIKLPEFNGYEVCKFVQDSESLQHTKVFLLKGGFEPIDENMLKNLRYVDIITKPFDSNALVSNIKKLLEEMPEAGPASASAPASSPAPAPPSAAPPPAPAPPATTPTPPAPAPSAPAPPAPAPPAAPEAPAAPAAPAAPSAGFEPPSPMEEIPSIPDDMPDMAVPPAAPSEINFGDIKDEIDSESILAEEDFSSSAPSYEDEILPSEEITVMQGGAGDKDNLAEEPSAEDLDNPFSEEPAAVADVSGSLTEEEMNIKQNIAMQEKELDIGSLTLEEMNIQKSIDAQKAQAAAQPADINVDMGVPEPDDETSDLFTGNKLDQPEPPSEPATMDVADDMFGAPDTAPAPAPPSIEDMEDQLFSDEPDMPEINYEPEPSSVSLEDPVSFAAPPEESPETMKLDSSEFEPPAPAPEPALPEMPMVDPMASELAIPQGITPEPDAAAIAGGMADLPGVEEFVSPTPAAPAVPEPPVQPEPPAPEAVAPPEPEPVMPEPVPAEPQLPAAPEVPAPAPEPLAAPAPPTQPVAETPGTAGIPQEELLRNIEDKLSHAVKEMLWEIMPPLTEKIIKDEIAALKAETEKSFE